MASVEDPGEGHSSLDGGAPLVGSLEANEAALEEAKVAKQRWQEAAKATPELRLELREIQSKVRQVLTLLDKASAGASPERLVEIANAKTEAENAVEEKKNAVKNAAAEEQDCEEKARASQKRALVLQRAREAEVDRLVYERLHAAVSTDIQRSESLEPPASSWVPAFTGAEEGTAVHLFVFFGVELDAGNFSHWPLLGLKTCSQVNVCPVELPGKGLFTADTIGNAHVLAETFIRDALEPILRDGRPFALLGFATGARIAYEVARRRPPLRLYVAGRAAPHCCAYGQLAEAGGDPTPLEIPEQPKEVLKWIISRKGGKDSILQSALQEANHESDPQEYLRKYSKPIVDNITLGATELRDIDIAGRPLPVRVPCRIRVFESNSDTAWPPSVIRNTWDRYGPAAGTKCYKKTYNDLSHEDLCSPRGMPLLRDVLADLGELVQDPEPRQPVEPLN